MAEIKMDNLVSSIDLLLKQNLVSTSNSIKENYIHSNIYQFSKISNYSKLATFSKTIETDLTSLSNEISHLNSYFHHYINDYLSVNKYLTSGSQSDVVSIPTLKLLQSSFSIKNDNLEKINIINPKLFIDYEKDFYEKKDKKYE